MQGEVVVVVGVVEPVYCMHDVVQDGLTDNCVALIHAFTGSTLLRMLWVGVVVGAL